MKIVECITCHTRQCLYTYVVEEREMEGYVVKDGPWCENCVPSSSPYGRIVQVIELQ
jgi:hypothetical protein